jgi:two-component system chemotaxis response regulator CheB
MPKIRVLIVDDAVVVRSRASKILAADPELEVVGVAAHGGIALAKIPQVNPDVVVLDVEMPEMNGLETLTVIRQRYPDLPVIMFSTFTRTGAAATLEALSLGASDYATKPSNLRNLESVNQHIRETLIPKIKVFGSGTVLPNLEIVPSPQRRLTEPIEVIAIGVSTGGPNALSVLLPELPSDLPVPVLIVQHMPSMFTKLLAERLDSKCQIQVSEAVPGAELKAGHAWIAPGDYHMVVRKQGSGVQIMTHQAPPENSCRPSVDVLFRSVAQVYKARSIAVVLTGMGQDGLHGCQRIREEGGHILVQDKASSVVWGMPAFVANAGLADQVVPLDQMAGEILRRVSQSKLNTGVV